VLGLGLKAPHWTCGRRWVLRLGHAELTAEKSPADDWAWLVDHSVQSGQEKCLAIQGVRLADLPPPGQCLRHRDMELIGLVPAKRWTAADVDAALEEAAEAAGHVPRVIVDDHGGDLHGGVERFRRRHPRTAEVYDIKHKAACLLKKLLGDDRRWREFTGCVGRCRCQVQQTELAYLSPPAPKLKARFMNLGGQLAWARRVLEKQQSRGGFTQLLLGFGAQLVRLTPQSVREMLQASRTKDVVRWARQNLGTTLFAQRKLAFAGATESG
jgi:hypothetical protein